MSRIFKTLLIALLVVVLSATTIIVSASAADSDVPTPTFSSNVNLSWAKSITVLGDGVYGTAGSFGDGKWAGNEGNDIIITVDLQVKREFDSVFVGFGQWATSGICPAGAVNVSTSEDGATYTPAGSWTSTKTPQNWFDNHGATGNTVERIEVSTPGSNARYVKVEIKNPGTFTKSDGKAYKTWVAIDEIEFVSKKATYEDLTKLVSLCNGVSLDNYTPASILKFDEAYRAAVAYIEAGNANDDTLQAVYTALLDAKSGLENPGVSTVISNKNWANVNNASALFDGTSGGSAKFIQGKVLSSLNPVKEQELELVIDMGKSTGIYAIGYISESRPWAGIYQPNAEFFVSDSQDGPWVSIASVKAKDHVGDIGVGQFNPNTAAADGTAGRYVKVVFTTCRDYEKKRADGYLCMAEWVFLHEILINEFCKIDVTAENATVEVTDMDGKALGILGARIGQDIKINATPAENARPSTITINGTSYAMTDNSYVIKEIAGKQTVNVTYTCIPEADLPVIKCKDLFFAVGSNYDLKFDVTATDKNGKDITSAIKVETHNVGTSAGKYSVTYSVTDEFGGTTRKTANVYLVSGLNGRYVIASTPLSSRLTNHQANIQKLLDGKTPAAGTNIWDSNNIYWQNEPAIEIVIYLGGETGIADLGYSLLSSPSMGLLAPDVEFYYSSNVANGWTFAGTIEATYHNGALNEIEYVNKLMDLKNIKASYVKAVIKYDTDPELRARYDEECKGFTGKGKPEWTFVSEIVVNPYYEISASSTAGGKVNASTANAQGALYGENVTVTFTPDEGYFLTGVTVNGQAVAVSGNTYTVSNVTEDTDIKATFTQIGIDTVALKHNGAIALIYYAYLPSLDGAKMQFEMNGKQVTVNGVATDKEYLYAFEFVNIAPQCMGDNVSAVLLVNDASVDTLENYSVKQYCNSLLESIKNKTIAGYTDQQYAALEQITIDLLEYGAKAQLYKSYKTDALVNAGIDGAREFVALDETNNAVVGAPAGNEAYFISAGVRFDYINSMFFKFAANADVTVRITDKATGAFRNYTLADCTELSEGIYVLYTDGILPDKYDTRYTVELINGENTAQTLEYGISAYVYYIQNESRDGALTPMAELARAMYNFGISAAEYKNLT